LTGHLVLSTLHTNDAPSSIIRLIDMGVEPFLISSSVIGVMAQRLVRKICMHCKKEVKLTSEIMKIFEEYNLSREEIKLYKGEGCRFCNGTGYKGRLGIFELIKITDTLRNLITGSAPLEKIREVALREGMHTLKEDGLRKVGRGITTLEEVIRVTAD
ncbi:MAG: Flp pilus assembly complex ATPase component TadA, partial [Candidatus Atribacteria bacterium]|nr:Flp pilus assembly complex ATPase component TadA [Candidatus Atribacteria bacterium]